MVRTGWALRWAPAAIGVSTIACGTPTQTPEGVGEATQPILTGTDEREDVYQLPAHGPARRNADGVALLAYASGFIAHDGVVEIPTATLMAAQGVCSSQPYADQPVATNGHCTAYLVAPRLVVTAGHCLNYDPVGTDETQFSVVFGFEMLDDVRARTIVRASDVYTTVSVAAVCDGGWDCSVLTLDRPVTNHTMLPIRRTGVPTTSDSVYMLGYPFVLPLKYDEPQRIARVTSLGLNVPLDSAGGNSGSPVLNSATNVVEATLSGYSSSDAPPWDTTDAGCRIEHVATPADNYTATMFFTSLFSNYVPPFCSGDAGGWVACASNGCGICSRKLDTCKYDLYLRHHPNCTIDERCSRRFSACSEACPPPGEADRSRRTPIRDEGVGDLDSDGRGSIGGRPCMRGWGHEEDEE
jgi:V8-like Glu-specific endopeptidase